MKEKKAGELVGAVVGNIIALAVINTVLLWRQHTQGVILESWVSILWAANLSLIVQLAGNAILAFYRPARFYSFLQLVFAALGLLSIFVFYSVFPLDFAAISLSWINTLVRVVLWVGMAGTAIAIVVWLVRFFGVSDYKSAAAR